MKRLVLALVGAVLLLVFAAASAAAPPSKSGSFTNYSLGEATGVPCGG